MTIVNILKNVVIGSAAGVATVVALPVFGAVGAISATGTVVASLAGAACGIYDSIFG